ncbi:hypothetical protein [Paenibacillus sp. MMO-177]|uniref:hypothetical protein n=1 Tax=Paenibacillus sp. MMO-177 TaxID=3081289 RepID=UPI0030173013
MKNQKEIMQFASRQTFVVVPFKSVKVKEFVYQCFIEFLTDSIKTERCMLEPANHILNLLDFSEEENGERTVMRGVHFLHNELRRMVEEQVVDKKFAAQVFRELVYDDGSDELGELEEMMLGFSEDFMKL